MKRDIDHVREIRSIINRRLDRIPDSDNMGIEELEDVSRLLYIVEGMLTKYQNHREMCHILEDMRAIIAEAALGIQAVDYEMNEMCTQSRMSCQQIQNARLMMHARPNVEDRRQIQTILAQATADNLTNSSKKADNCAYIPKTKEGGVLL